MRKERSTERQRLPQRNRPLPGFVLRRGSPKLGCRYSRVFFRARSLVAFSLSLDRHVAGWMVVVVHRLKTGRITCVAAACSPNDSIQARCAIQTRPAGFQTQS